MLKGDNYLPGANADKMYGFVTDAGNTTEDDNGKYREFTVWTSNNEEKVVKMKATSTSIKKGDLISFDMTADDFIEGVSSVSQGTLDVKIGALDQFGKDYMVLFDGTDLTLDDDVKYVYVNGEDGVSGDGLEQAYENANGGRYNNVKYVKDAASGEVVMVALNTAAEGWDGSATTPNKDVANVVGNVASGAKATVSVKDKETTVNLSGTVTKGVGSLSSVFDGKEGNDTDLTVVTLKGIIPETGDVTIKQENDALKVYYNSTFASGVKTATYNRTDKTGGENNGDYSLLVQEGKTATVTVSNDKGVIATYVVTTDGLTVND
ncbi:MAG: hypothetical protein ACLTWR_03410 [Agathobaculum desmolans]|uniref:hypothetical protein n=1 Tax=Agathobaculum desmolans TaxID=39484 RepID=UPI003992BE78